MKPKAKTPARSDIPCSELQYSSMPLCFPGGRVFYSIFFFNDTATTEIYTLSLHDALPILSLHCCPGGRVSIHAACRAIAQFEDRKSTRLNSSHVKISYAVFCLKKKKK